MHSVISDYLIHVYAEYERDTYIVEAPIPDHDPAGYL